MTRPLVLASSSPQRQAILHQLKIPFEVVAPQYVEIDPADADPVELVRRHAEGKARSVHTRGRLTLGVDTTVHVDGHVLAKPDDDVSARMMLERLSGRRHDVVSGVCLLGTGPEVVAHAVTTVFFRPLVGREIDAYIATCEWKGRAGGYAIQGLAGRFVTRIEGDYLNVVGLPAAVLVDLLMRHAPWVLGFSEPGGDDH